MKKLCGSSGEGSTMISYFPFCGL